MHQLSADDLNTKGCKFKLFEYNNSCLWKLPNTSIECCSFSNPGHMGALGCVKKPSKSKCYEISTCSICSHEQELFRERTDRLALLSFVFSCVLSLSHMCLDPHQN